MINNKEPENPSSMGEAKKSREEINKTLQQAKNDPAVNDALKKEKQPARADDLSPIHNTTAIGTSGGDQRASESEINKAAEE